MPFYRTRYGKFDREDDLRQSWVSMRFSTRNPCLPRGTNTWTMCPACRWAPPDVSERSAKSLRRLSFRALSIENAEKLLLIRFGTDDVVILQTTAGKRERFLRRFAFYLGPSPRKIGKNLRLCCDPPRTFYKRSTSVTGFDVFLSTPTREKNAFGAFAMRLR